MVTSCWRRRGFSGAMSSAVGLGIGGNGFFFSCASRNADHPPLDRGQHVAHQTIGAGRLARAGVADHHRPQVRRFAPSWPGLRPPRVADQRRDACEQRRDDIIDRAGRGDGRIEKPLFPGLAEDLERQRWRRPPS
jgi:hypothetical protein